MENKKWLFLVLCCLSCGPTYKLKKAERLIREAESAGLQWKVDTVHKIMKVAYPEVHVKEVHHAPPQDTVLIEKERLKIKVVRLPGDSIFVEGKCESDTIVVRTTHTVTKTIDAKGGIKWWWLILAGLIGAGAIALFKK